MPNPRPKRQAASKAVEAMTETRLRNSKIEKAAKVYEASERKASASPAGKENNKRVIDEIIDFNQLEPKSLLKNKKAKITPDKENVSPSAALDKKASKSRAKKSTMKSTKQPKKPAKRRTKVEIINDKLEKLGVKFNKGYGGCVRAGLSKCGIKLTGNPSDLDQIILSGDLECGHRCDAKLRELLDQPDYAGTDYEDGLQEATVTCNDPDCAEGRTYVTHICSGNPSFDSGKFHNHCFECKGFGKCIGDYRMAHCDMCGKHYWAGLMGGDCDCQKRYGFYNDEYDSDDSDRENDGCTIC